MACPGCVVPVGIVFVFPRFGVVASPVFLLLIAVNARSPWRSAVPFVIRGDLSPYFDRQYLSNAFVDHLQRENL